jgi:hypothetical protein
MDSRTNDSDLWSDNPTVVLWDTSGPGSQIQAQGWKTVLKMIDTFDAALSMAIP